jgi:hypothetical protein
VNHKALAAVQAQLSAILDPIASGGLVDYYLSAEIDHEGHLVVAANARGLAHLAAQLVALAQKPSGAHFHLDEHSGITEGGAAIIVSKVAK